jgi:hypothetical protein
LSLEVDSVDLVAFVVQTLAVARVLRIMVVLVAVGVAAAVAALVFVNWRASENELVLVVEVPFTTDGVGATTIGRIIFIDADRSRDSDLLAHELVHVCQWEESGIEFLWDYSSELVSNYEELGDLRESYLRVSFEEQARAGEIDCNIDSYRIVRP